MMLQLNKIYNMDCLEGMKQLKDNSIDLIVTDPPYGISYKSNAREVNYQFKDNHKWDVNFNLIPYFDEMWRVLKENGLIYMFGRWDSLKGFNRIPDGCLIWDKMDYGMGDLKFWSMNYEFIYIFKKGNANFKWHKRPHGMLKVYKLYNPLNEEIKHKGNNKIYSYMKHPTQKPEKIIRLLIEKHDVNLILDPFMGSGTTAVACKQLDRNFIGFEISKEYCDIANERLKQNNLKNWF